MQKNLFNDRLRRQLVLLFGLALFSTACSEADGLLEAKPDLELLNAAPIRTLYVGQVLQVPVDVKNRSSIALDVELQLLQEPGTEVASELEIQEVNSAPIAEFRLVQSKRTLLPGEIGQLILEVRASSPGQTWRSFFVRDANEQVEVTGNLFVNIQAPPDCDDGNNCTQNFFDLGLNRCRTVPQNDGLRCGEDDLCLIDGVCTSGVCVGEQKNCDDGVECTIDTCDSNFGCQALADDSICDDDDSCTNDACSASGCTNEAKDEGSVCFFDGCDGIGTCQMNACIVVATPDDTPCDDQDSCTERDVCSAGECVGTPVTSALNGLLDLEKSDLIVASAEICGQGVCVVHDDIPFGKLERAYRNQYGQPTFIWTSGPLSPYGELCSNSPSAGSWPMLGVLNHDADSLEERSPPPGEAPGQAFIPCRRALMSTTIEQADALPEQDFGPITRTRQLSTVDDAYQVITFERGAQDYVAVVNQDLEAPLPVLEVFSDATRVITEDLQTTQYLSWSAFSLAFNPATDSLMMVLVPALRTQTFVDPDLDPPTMQWPVFQAPLSWFLGQQAVNTDGPDVDSEPPFVYRAGILRVPRVLSPEPFFAGINMQGLSTFFLGDGSIRLLAHFSLDDAGTGRENYILRAVMNESPNWFLDQANVLGGIFETTSARNTFGLHGIVDSSGDEPVLQAFIEETISPCEDNLEESGDVDCQPLYRVRRVTSNNTGNGQFWGQQQGSGNIGLAPLSAETLVSAAPFSAQEWTVNSTQEIWNFDSDGEVSSSFYGPPVSLDPSSQVAAFTLLDYQGKVFFGWLGTGQCLQNQTDLPLPPPVD